MPKGVFWEVWRSSRRYVACRFFVSSCLSFWLLACLCSLFELESLVYSLNEISVIPLWLHGCDREFAFPASQLRGKTNPTFLCASWFLKRMYRPCLMIIIKSCSVKYPSFSQVPTALSAFHALFWLPTNQGHTFVSSSTVCTARWPCMWSAHDAQTNQYFQKCKFCNISHKIK